MSHGEQELQSNTAPSPFAQTFFHGTKADLKVGDLITVGFNANNGQQAQLRHVYCTATLDAAIWGAELARGEGSGRIYVVEATGPLEDDPNLTNKKFPGNPTMSYRSLYPLRVVGELTVWQAHAPEQVQQMQEALARLKEQGNDLVDN